MTSGYIPAPLRRRLRAEGGYRCAYCRSSEMLTGMPLELDHIIPRSRGGQTDPGNLCLACHRCNEHKSDRTEAPDPVTGEAVALFNPRAQAWREHFRWRKEGVEVIGATACGRATVRALRLNSEELVAARHVWVAIGLHPPLE